MAKFRPPGMADRKVINTPDQITYDAINYRIIRARVIKTGRPNKPYLPKDPGRRRRLLKALGISDDTAPAD